MKTGLQNTSAKTLTAAAILSVAFAAGFAHAGQSEVVGTLLGAGTGGYIGNQFGHGSGRVAATTGGVIFGGLAGNSIGDGIDQSAASSGRSSFYSQDYYPYVQQAYYTPYAPNYVAPPAPPPEALQENPSDYCREYSQLVRIGDAFQEKFGTACLQPDGSWKAVD